MKKNYTLWYTAFCCFLIALFQTATTKPEFGSKHINDVRHCYEKEQKSFNPTEGTTASEAQEDFQHSLVLQGLCVKWCQLGDCKVPNELLQRKSHYTALSSLLKKYEHPQATAAHEFCTRLSSLDDTQTATDMEKLLAYSELVVTATAQKILDQYISVTKSMNHNFRPPVYGTSKVLDKDRVMLYALATPCVFPHMGGALSVKGGKVTEAQLGFFSGTHMSSLIAMGLVDNSVGKIFKAVMTTMSLKKEQVTFVGWQKIEGKWHVVVNMGGTIYKGIEGGLMAKPEVQKPLEVFPFYYALDDDGKTKAAQHVVHTTRGAKRSQDVHFKMHEKHTRSLDALKSFHKAQMALSENWSASFNMDGSTVNMAQLGIVDREMMDKLRTSKKGQFS